MTDPEHMKPLVPALSRGVQIMDLVGEEPDALTLAELSRRLGVAKSSVHSLCATLLELGLLRRNSDQTFAIGPHVMRWSRAFARRTDVATEFARIWDENTSELQGATITLSVPDGNEVVYIGARNSNCTPWFQFRVGSRLPMAFTATGYAMMSWMSDAEIRLRYRDGLPEPMTPFSPRSLDRILELVHSARARGYSREEQSVSEGMVCFGAAVMNAQNAVIAGVAVSLPIDEVTPEYEAHVVATLRQIAATISQRLGADIDA